MVYSDVSFDNDTFVRLAMSKIIIKRSRCRGATA